MGTALLTDGAVLLRFRVQYMRNPYPVSVLAKASPLPTRGLHRSLLRQDCLIAGANTLSEAPEFSGQLLLAPTKIASHATAEDAKVLALYEGLLPGTNIYNHFIETCIE